jgi:hypothetical protein
VLLAGARWLQLPQGYYLWTWARAGQLSSNRPVLWENMIENAQSLLDHPSVESDAALSAELEHFVRRIRSLLIVSSVRSLIRQRYLVQLMYLLLKQPSAFVALAQSIVRRIRLFALSR